MDEFFNWLGGVAGAALAVLGGLIPNFGPQETVYYGYVEVDYVYVAPASAGTIEDVMVAAGDRVEAGAPLFRLDARMAEAALASARARAAAARADLENAMTGQRPEELAITERSLERARSDLELAQQNYDRTNQLFTQGVVPRARLDQDNAALMAAQSAVEELEAQLTVGRLPARPAALEAARAQVSAADAEVTQLEAALSDRTGTAPVAGEVDEVYFAAGEQASPSRPVVSIAPDGNLEIRFFVAESERPALAPGDEVSVSCKGCGDPISARVTWLASDAQFNPPIIYSRQEREDLVFLVKAKPEGSGTLRPGQPVEVRPVP
jgi:HlyD family secretion protein